MSSTLKGVCASLALSTALSLLGSGSIAAAQSSGPSITASGCVNRAANNGSLAGGPGVPSTTPNRAAVLANSNEPTDVILLNGATPPRSSEAPTRAAAATVPVSYVLDGALRDLEPHLGHQVEITGTLQTANEGAKEAKTMVRHIRVASIKTIATECPKPKNQ